MQLLNCEQQELGSRVGAWGAHVHLCHSGTKQRQKTPHGLEMFAIYNITLGLALTAMFYAVIFNAMKSLMEVGRVHSK